jgi:hypothetical protein
VMVIFTFLFGVFLTMFSIWLFVGLMRIQYISTLGLITRWLSITGIFLGAYLIVHALWVGILVASFTTGLF